MRRDDRAAVDETAEVCRDDLLARMRPLGVQRRVPRGVGRAQRFGGQRADDVGGRAEDLGVMQGEAADRGHHLRAIDERKRLLRRELERPQIRALQRFGAADHLPFERCLALAHEHQRRVRERREVTGRAHAPVHRDHRFDPAIEQVKQQVDRLRPHARASSRQRVRAEQQHRVQAEERRRIAVGQDAGRDRPPNRLG